MLKNIETVVKTTSIKVKNSQDKLKLLEVFRDYTQVASQVNKDIFSSSFLINFHIYNYLKIIVWISCRL